MDLSLFVYPSTPSKNADIVVALDIDPTILYHSFVYCLSLKQYFDYLSI